jgi:tetratricopeptide (TPR) repeat protein
MRSCRQCTMVGAVALLVLGAWPASAQTPPGGAAKPRPAAAGSPAAAPKGDDLAAIHKRFQELYAARNYNAALVEAQKFEAAVKARLGTSHQNYGTALDESGDVYEAQGKRDEAEALYKQALTVYEKVRGVSQLNVANTLDNLGKVNQRQGKYAEAEGFYNPRTGDQGKSRGRKPA